MIVAAVAGLTACGGGFTVSLPEGPGAPIRDPAARFASATAPCADVRSVVAESRVSGTVGRARVRATLLIGIEWDGRARIEALAGPGGPLLVLTARDEEATLVLPRDNEVLQGASLAEILDALVGVRIDAADLGLSLVGCFAVGGAPDGGRSYGGGVSSFDLPGDAVVWTRLSSDGHRPIGGRRGPLTVTYERPTAPAPSRVRFQVRDGQTSGASTADLTLTLSSVEVNGAIDPDAFVARVPRGAQPIGLDELRRSGPLGGAASR